MALTDKTITVVAGSTKVLVLQISTSTRDGIPVLAVTGQAQDDQGNVVGLVNAQGKLDPTDPNFQGIMQLALVALQQANGLDDSDPVVTSLDPKVALQQAQAALAKARAEQASAQLSQS